MEPEVPIKKTADNRTFAECLEDWAKLPISERLCAVRHIRKAQGLTLTQLAKRSGLSVPYLSMLENGKRTDIKLSTLEKIGTGLGQGAWFRAEFAIVSDHVTYYPVA